jgi:hypothetical protein
LREGTVQEEVTADVKWLVPVWLSVFLRTAGVFGARHFHFSFLHFGGCGCGVEVEHLDLARLSLLHIGAGKPVPVSSFINPFPARLAWCIWRLRHETMIHTFCPRYTGAGK